MLPTNIEPLHREQGAYRNWINHTRGRSFRSWAYWMRDMQLISSGDNQFNRRRNMEKGTRKKSQFAPPGVERKYIDPSGVPSVVLVPEGSNNLAAGIPLSLDISSLYAHMPEEFVVEFTKALHEQGLIKPADYFQRGASDRYKAALLMVIRNDFLSIQALAKQVLEQRS